MKRIWNEGNLEIWHDIRADEFYAYAADKLIRVCPSIGMAHEVLAGH